MYFVINIFKAKEPHKNKFKAKVPQKNKLLTSIISSFSKANLKTD